MSNPTFMTGNLTREVGKSVKPYILVKLNEGKIEPNDASTFPFGAVTEAGDPKPDGATGAPGLPYKVRVHTSQAVVKLSTDDTGFKDGTPVYAAADGKVSKSGTVKVGIADRAESDKLVRVNLFHPAAFSS